MTKKILVALLGIASLAAVLAGAVGYFTPPAEPSAPAADPAALVRFHSPSLGEPDARVHIVEFLDPACETCRSFYPLVKEFMHANPGRVRVSIRYAPFHRGSEDVVRLLEAARKQGKFWPTLEALLTAQSQWTVQHTARLDLALNAIQGVGLDMDKLQEDMQAPDVARVIRQDIQDAVSLNVTKTPEFFVNGRPLPSFGYEQLRSLVEQALREAYG